MRFHEAARRKEGGGPRRPSDRVRARSYHPPRPPSRPHGRPSADGQRRVMEGRKGNPGAERVAVAMV
ncbi:hypothetical protein GWI33_005564 [Rhynchophorus ferrugineus]|uniref:Uncharacterized protein n=1 Tax=Rhynchophorus ferrugineus TaxID=354439 RepID=A0A834IVR8_RHYFE|nr:hypothetical protein GWI33_005564 [Rhynchophorus ferrugineus]